MKKLLIMSVTAILICLLFASCGTDDTKNPINTTDAPGTTDSIEDNIRDDITESSEEGHTFMESLSEVFSEGMSDMSILDPENGTVSDPAQTIG